jgi:hypothetical protein
MTGDVCGIEKTEDEADTMVAQRRVSKTSTTGRIKNNRFLDQRASRTP